jgi:hypothetical protein
LALSSTNSLWRFWIDGDIPALSTATSTFGLRALNVQIGKGIGQFYFQGNLSTILVFNSVLSLANMNLVGQFLSRIWGIPWVTVS